MRHHSHTLVKDDTRVSYGITRFDDLRPDGHGRRFWWLIMFEVENDQLIYIHSDCYFLSEELNNV